MPHTNNKDGKTKYTKGGKKDNGKGGGGGGGGKKVDKKKCFKGKKDYKNVGSINPHTNRPSGKLELTFNPGKRVDYLTGFSARKKERRAFGLAMQKVKDRKARLEERGEERERLRKHLGKRRRDSDGQQGNVEAKTHKLTNTPFPRRS